MVISSRMQVLIISADGALTNRSLFTLLSAGNGTLHTRYLISIQMSQGTIFYFISDPPHLLKTIRNCVSSKKRKLHSKVLALDKGK